MKQLYIMYVAVWSVFLVWALIVWGLFFSPQTASVSIEEAKKQMWMGNWDIEVLTDTTINADSRSSSRKEAIDTENLKAPEILVDEERMAEMPVVEIEQTQAEVESNSDAITLENLPDEINLEVPFYPQAPDANWWLPWKEACEESSVALAYHYVSWKDLTKETFKSEIQWMVSLQNEIFWQYIDTNMSETAQFLEQYYDYKDYKLIDEPTVDDLKLELANGHPIVAPFSGKELWNSFFTNGGPRYHVLVIVWYKDWFFLTNDVGTSRWENFAYSFDVIMNAMHDLVREWDIWTWEKRVLVLQ